MFFWKSDIPGRLFSIYAVHIVLEMYNVNATTRLRMQWKFEPDHELVYCSIFSTGAISPLEAKVFDPALCAALYSFVVLTMSPYCVTISRHGWESNSE